MLLEVGEEAAEVGEIVFDGKRGEVFGFEVGFELSEDDLGIVDGVR